MHYTEIMEAIENIGISEKKLDADNKQLREEIRLIKKSIYRMGLNAHLEKMIEEIKKEENREVPF